MVRSRLVVWACTVLSASLMLVAVGAVLTAPTPVSIVNLVIGLLVVPAAVGVGVLIARRDPHNLVAAALAFLALTVATIVAEHAAIQVLAERPETAQALAWLVAVLAEGWWPFAAVALLALCFPDGRLPGRRWRWVPLVLVVSVVWTQVYGAFEDVPFREPLADLARPFDPPPQWLELASLPIFVLMLALILACALSLVGRYRRGDALTRVRVKWLALGGTGVAAFPLLCLAEIAVLGRPWWISLAAGVLSLVAVPVSVGVAVLRHDLYDVDKALAGAATWGLLSGALIGVYAATALVAGLLLGRGSAVAVAVATATCALALAPLRRRIQQIVDRRLYPLRTAAFAAIEALHRDVGAGTADPEALEDVLRGALRDPRLRIGYRSPDSDDFVTADGVRVEADDGAVVAPHGTVTGVLVPGNGLATRELLDQVAERCTPMVEVVRLRMELARALQEVTESRSRLVQVGYDERRRLERDLHDGAQQRLVTLGMAIRLAQRHLADGTADVAGLLDHTVAELGTAVAELRRIAHGIRPGCLDDGLPAALTRMLGTVPLDVHMSVDPGPLPDKVGVTAYYVVSEAVTNAVKHAGASRIDLEVSRADGRVVIRVRDDGSGGARLDRRSSLADRVAAVGGSVAVHSPPGRGTVVEAELPCAS